MQRNTCQRQVVLSAVQSLCHATAEAIYVSVAKQYPTISKATVYRNLRLLAKNRQIRLIDGTLGADYFDKTVTPHYHLQCTECGKLFDVSLPYMEKLNAIPTDSGFTITDHSVLFKGVCAYCNQQKGK